ncbi:MAG: GAF domain-containing protein, partial [Anaerolineae bacterium]
MGDLAGLVGVVYIVPLIMGVSLLLTYYYRARQGAVDRSWKYFLVAAFLFILAQAAGVMAIFASGYDWFLYGLAALAFWSVALRLLLEGERDRRKGQVTRERISLLSQSVTDLDLLLDRLLEVLQDSMGVAGCSMMLLDEGGFRFAAAKGLGSDLPGMQGCTLSPQDETVQEIMAAREPICITEAASWLPDKHPSFFCLPLVSGGEVVGIINLYHPDLKRLDLGQAELLKAFAFQAALAIEKARLREATRQAEAVSTLLREMHHRIKNSLQMVADLLYLEVKNCESRSAVRSLLASIARIKSIAAVHEILSIEPPTLTDAKKLAERLARVSRDGLMGPDSRIDITVEGESLLLSSR